MAQSIPADQPSAETPDTPGAVLAAAAAAIERHGWCQSIYEDYSGRLCAVGAINLVTSGDAVYSLAPLARAAKDMLTAFLDNDGLVPAWNDEPSRTKDEVLAALRAAAEAVTA